jgi:hypothetical protein
MQSDEESGMALPVGERDKLSAKAPLTERM